jgi:hypothetical protein
MAAACRVRLHESERDNEWSYPDLMEGSGLSDSGGSQELLFVVLDELEEGQVSLGVGAERSP